MKSWLRPVILLLLVIVVYGFAGAVQAQHSCGSCCPGSSRTCSDVACTIGCTDTPSCTLGNATNLAYVGNANPFGVDLSWTAAANATEYSVDVQLVGGGSITGYPKIVATTTDSFTGTAGAQYNWSVTPRNTCYTGSAASGPTVGIPRSDNFTLAYGEAEACVNSACNGADLIVSADANHNRRIPVRATFYHPNAPSGSHLTEIGTARINFDNTADWNDGTFYRVRFTDNGDGTYEIVEEAGDAKTDQIDILGATATTTTGNDLIIDFTLDLTNMAAGADFLANVYFNSWDFNGVYTSRVLKLGAGDFSHPPADPYSGNPSNALDIWNGKDVNVTPVGYYQVSDYQDVCTQAGLPASVSFELEPSYSPNSDPLWPVLITDWDTVAHYQPYYYYNPPDLNEITYAPSAGYNYFLTGMSSERYGGDCVAATAGSVVNSFKNGGLRVGEEGIGDSTLEMAFAVLPVAGSWSNIVDGSFLTNANLTVSIEPITCPACYFTTRVASTTNGITLANGDINVQGATVYGSPNNWYAKTQSGTRPFTRFELPTYAEIKELYNGSGYTELSGDQTTGVGSLATVTPDTTYFINGNLTVNSSTLLEVAQDHYLLFVINGNLTITNAVKDSSAGADGAAVEAIFVVVDNGTGTGDITVADDASDNNDTVTIEGSLAAGGTIDFARTLYTNNNFDPSVNVVFRPDMLAQMKATNVGIISIEKMLVSQY